MEYILAIIFAVAFVLAIFWGVARTIGRLRIVRNSPTLDDIIGHPQGVNGKLSVRVRQIADNGDILGATSLHSEEADTSFSDAQRAVEWYVEESKKLSACVRQLADDGNKLEACKIHKGEARVSLMEAKKAVEAYLGVR